MTLILRELYEFRNYIYFKMIASYFKIPHILVKFKALFSYLPIEIAKVRLKYPIAGDDQRQIIEKHILFLIL